MPKKSEQQRKRTNSLEKVPVSSSQELRNWLEKHHGSDKSVWLVTFKKTVDNKYLSTSAVLDELIAFGWIDGVRRKLDTHRTMQLISPRKTQHWAQSYKNRAEKLIQSGRMDKPGYESIESSKKMGL